MFYLFIYLLTYIFKIDVFYGKNQAKKKLRAAGTPQIIFVSASNCSHKGLCRETSCQQRVK